MKRLIATAAAALLVATTFGAPALADKGGNSGGNGGGHGGGHGNGVGRGASEMSPGHMKSGDDGASIHAPGRIRSGTSAGVSASGRASAPGQMKKTAPDDSTASIRPGNYGTLISLLRSGRGDVSDVPPDIAVNIRDVDDVIPNGNRQALDNALAARSAEIVGLREELDALDIDALDVVDLDDIVAAEVAADGTLIVYVD